MSLPKIENTTPIVKPAVDEKTYPDLYIVGLNISYRRNQQKLQAMIKLIPYNYTTEEMGSVEDIIVLRVEDLEAKAAELAGAGKTALAEALIKVVEAAGDLIPE